MNTSRKVEVFSAGRAVCRYVIELVERIACPCCDVAVLDMHSADISERVKQLGVTRVPAVAIDGTLAECCGGGGPDEKTLRAAGLGVTLS